MSDNSINSAEQFPIDFIKKIETREVNREQLLNQLPLDQHGDGHMMASRQLIESYFKFLPIGILVWEKTSGEILRTNPEIEKIVGLSENELVGKSIFELYNTDSGWCSYSPENKLVTIKELPSYKAVTKGTISKNILLQVKSNQGKKRWILLSSAPIKNEDLETCAVITIMQDIDTYIRIEAKVRANEERLNYALTASDEGLWDYNFKKDTGYLSPRYFAMLGYTREKFQGDITDWKKLLHPGDKALAIRTFQDVVQNKKSSYNSTFRLRTKSGDYRWILSRAIVVERDQFDKPVRVVGTHLDVTELRNMEDALREANRKLKKQVRNKTERLNQSLSVSKRVTEELTELNLLETQGQDFIANSPEMQEILSMAIKFGRIKVANILITGESGTGKSRLAKLIHEISQGKKKPFIQINCAALPENLLEAELFGYEKGAFTGANEEGKAGLFELADGGTLFLDEIGEIPISLQAKLLKYLDDKEVMHLGGLTPIKINCTVVAATNADLPSLIKQKKFRHDLFFRLNTFPINIQPLRDRSEDLLPLTNYFIETYNKQYGLNRRITTRGMKILQNYHFPGNTRELKNMLNKVIVLSENDVLDDLLNQELGRNSIPHLQASTTPTRDEYDFEKEVASFEIQLLTNAIEKHKTTRAIAAQLNMSQSAVVRRIKRHGLTKLFKKKI